MVGCGDEQLILRDDANQMLIGRSKQIARQRGERLRPSESSPARKRNDMSRRVDRVERAVRSERRLPDVGANGINPPAAEIEP
ncbi:MAG: hypothetical protein AUI09_02035 [Gemmatimonadetes bacterium 13_2_20CM_2_66_5]|nr:MAG: hypothetical protein AUI09_02035 [Gemmatimonadetes bacterium 13_2_20CM_2_66_5]